MKPGVDGKVFVVKEAGENVGMFSLVVWLSTNQNVPTLSPASFAINTSPLTQGFILAITPEES